MNDLFPHSGPIKALSLWQPWASLMAAGFKLHETRHWATPYRGPLAIHAAKTLDLAGAPEDLCIAAWGPHWRDAIPLGAVLAVGELTICTTTDQLRARGLTRADQESGNFTAGRFAWRFDDVRALVEPVTLAGRQGLFNWAPPSDLNRRLRPPVDHGAQCQMIGWL